MENVFDYLKLRGGLSLDTVPATAEDYLVFSMLAYCPFEELEGVNWKGKSLLALKDRIFLDNRPANGWNWWKSLLKLWRRIPDYPRFANIRLMDFVYEFDKQKPIQFAAAVFRTSRGTVVAFRGTDLSVTGWKENFMLGYAVPVPGQISAVSLIDRLPPDSGPVTVCGHSKGGNLAMYSALHAKDPSQITGIYNFDGPGMDEGTVASERWQKTLPLIHSYIPQSSVVGLLLGYAPHYITVAATAHINLMQHNSFLWLFEGPHFMTVRDVTVSSSMINQTLHDFLETCSKEQLKTLCTALNKYLDASRAERVDRLLSDIALHLTHIIATNRSFTPEETVILRELRSLLIKSIYSTVTLRIRLNMAKKRLKITDEAEMPEAGKEPETDKEEE